MIKILAVSPLKFDGTSFYRAWGVFKDLNEKISIEVTDYGQKPGGWSWPDLCSHDVLFLQRPGTPEHLKLAHYCKDLGLKVWVDYDDNFFVLPPENRMFDSVEKSTKERMAEIIGLADAITVSTGALKDFMVGSGGKYVEVVPNALNVQLFRPVTKFNHKRPQIPPNPQKQVYVWRGSDTHQLDVFDYLDPITNAMAARADVDWVYMGWRPSYLDRFGLQYRYLHPDDIFNYWRKLKMIRPELMHVCLTANQFNLNKSNIAWIEATAAGAVCVAPKWPEWERPGVLTYETGTEYEAILTAGGNFSENWTASMDYINENLLLSKVNRQRADLLDKLMGGWDFKMVQPVPQSMVE